MQDDEKKIQDLHLDNDLDFDDPEEDEDLDESWDSESEIEDLESFDSPAANMASRPVKQRTFLQKNFNLIVFGIVLVGGGLFAMSKFGGSPDQAPDAQIAQPPLPVVDELAPSQAPAPEDTASGATGEPSLTPMPVPENPPVNESVSQDAPSSAPPAQNDAQTTDETAGTLLLPPETTENKDAASTILPEGVLPEGMSEDALLASQQPPEPETPAPADQEASAAQTALLEDKLKALETSAKTKEAELVSKLDERDAKIAELSKTVESLKEQVNALEQAPKASKQDLAPQEPEAPSSSSLPVQEDTTKPLLETNVPEETAVKVETKEKAKARTKPREETPALPETPQNWVLRSAQPGKAVIALEGSNDLQSVTAGQTVKGLGKILSITQDNGRWVVQGTKGSVSQR